jgi:outer membrane receptor protein involved in Fe transport
MITGDSGERLPGSPRWSAAIQLSYRHDLGADRTLALTAGSTYTSAILNTLPSAGNPQQQLPAYAIENFSATLSYPKLRYTAYVNNIADKRAVLGIQYNSDVPIVGPLATYQIINHPREIGIRIAYTGLK